MPGPREPRSRDTKPQTPNAPPVTFPAVGKLPGHWEFGRLALLGHAWMQAVASGRSTTDERLARGRTYARTGKVGPITVAPGAVTARVAGSGDWDYTVTIAAPQLTDADWARVCATICATPRYVASVFGGPLELGLLQDVRDAGVDLVPGAVGADCTCPDWGSPCKHVAAVAYQVGELFEKDLLTLFLLRGRGHEQMTEVLDPPARTAADTPAAVLHDRAADVLNTPESPADQIAAILRLPIHPSAPHREELPGAPAPDLPAAPGIDSAGLAVLAAAAAAAARILLNRPAGHDEPPQPLLAPATGWDDMAAVLADVAEAAGLVERIAAVYDVARTDVEHAAARYGARRPTGRSGRVRPPVKPASVKVADARREIGLAVSAAITAGFKAEVEQDVTKDTGRRRTHSGNPGHDPHRVPLVPTATVDNRPSNNDEAASLLTYKVEYGEPPHLVVFVTDSWLRQVVRPGYAVLGGFPILEILGADADDRPVRVKAVCVEAFFDYSIHGWRAWSQDVHCDVTWVNGKATVERHTGRIQDTGLG